MAIPLDPISPREPIQLKVESGSYLHKLAALVALIYTTFSDISQKERGEIVRLEQQYSVYAKESADLTRSRGNLAFATACLCMMVFAASFALTNPNDKKFVQLASEKLPDFMKIIDGHREGAIKSKDSLAQLEMTRMQEKTNKASSEGNMKEQFASVLQTEIQRLRSASSSAN
jgi:hypothetical protein